MKLHFIKEFLFGIFFCFLFLSNITFGQQDSSVTIELSTPHGERIKSLNDCTSPDNKVYVIIRNNADSTIYFYETWNSYGYYNYTFEIQLRDSIYTIQRPKKLWYRNFPSTHRVEPGENLSHDFILIDSSCVEIFQREGIYKDGWTGFPSLSDSALIRVRYFCEEDKRHGYEGINNYLRYRSETNYQAFLEEDIQTTNMIYPPPGERDLQHEPSKSVIYPYELYSQWYPVYINATNSK